MRNVYYPSNLRYGSKIAISAPSSGVNKDLHPYLEKAIDNVEQRGYETVIGQSVWSNHKCVSVTKEYRAKELNRFLTDESISVIFPPWGGEFLMEVLPLLDWERIKYSKPKWILGYSDISTLAFTYTINTGIASAHGTNLFDLCLPKWDSLTAKWVEVLQMKPGDSLIQNSSAFHQSSWDNFNLNKGFDLDTQTKWQVLKKETSSLNFSGRFLGGCIDTISTLIGTPFDNVNQFISDYCKDSGVIWYLESSNMDAVDLYRHLWQMKMNGWFNFANGILIGRLPNKKEKNNFTLEDSLHESFKDLNIPIIYNVDVGHMPPQITLVNGGLGTVLYKDGGGSIQLSFT